MMLFAGVFLAGIVLVGAGGLMEPSLPQQDPECATEPGPSVESEQQSLAASAAVQCADMLPLPTAATFDRVTLLVEEVLEPDVPTMEEAAVELPPVRVETSPVADDEAPPVAVDTATTIEPVIEPIDDTDLWDAPRVFMELSQRLPPGDGLLHHLFGRWRSGPSSVERRGGVERLTCDVAAVCKFGESEVSLSLANIGVGGLEVYSAARLPVKARVELKIQEADSVVKARVVWCLSDLRGYRAGLEFEEAPETLAGGWVAQLMYDLGAQYLLARAPRRFVRVSTALSTSFEIGDGKSVEVTLLDVSLGGCLLRSPSKLEREVLSLDLGGVECRGTVIGCRFTEEGWMHHLRFDSLSRLETVRLRRSIRYLLSAQNQRRSLVVEARSGEQAV